MKVLFVGAHCDDIELGCGGTLAQFAVMSPHTVQCVMMTSVSHPSQGSMRDVCQRAMQELGVKKANLYFHVNQEPCCLHDRRHQLFDDIKYATTEADLIFTHAPDEHQDHVAVYEATIRAAPKTASILLYQATNWSAPDFRPTVFNPVNAIAESRKRLAIDHYRAFYRDKKPYLNPAAVTTHLNYWGLRTSYATVEAFQPYRFFPWHGWGTPESLVEITAEDIETSEQAT